MAGVLPEVPFGGAEQTQPGFIQGMIQSLASPFNPAPNPIPAPTGAAPVAGPSVTTPPPQGGSQGGGVMDVLGKVGQFATNFLIGMGDDTGRYREMMRKQRGARVSADALLQVNEAVNAGNVDQADKVIAQAARVVQPEHVPLLQKMMDKVQKVRDSQEFTNTLIPSVQMMSTGSRPEVMAFLQGAQKVGMDPKLIMQTLNEQFKLTPHFENGQLFMFEPSGGLTKEGPQALPQVAKSSEFEKYSKALQAAGYESPAQFANLLNIHDPQAMTDALRLGQLQNMIDQKEATDLEQKKTNIQVAGQIKASGARIGMEEASQKRMVMFRNLNEFPPEQVKLEARALGLDPNRPMAKYAPEEAQAVLLGMQARDLQKARETGAATAGERPLSPEQQKELEGHVKMSVLTDRLLTEFTPEQRRQYSGLFGARLAKSSFSQAFQDATGQQVDPQYAKFAGLLNTVVGTQMFLMGGKTLPGGEAGILYGIFPTGKEPSSEMFEQKLHLHNRLSKASEQNMLILSGPRSDLPGKMEQLRQNLTQQPLDTEPPPAVGRQTKKGTKFTVE